MAAPEPGPEEIEEMDTALARRDRRHRAKRLEAAITDAFARVWWKVTRWALKHGRKAKDRRTKAQQELHKLTWTARR